MRLGLCRFILFSRFGMASNGRCRMKQYGFLRIRLHADSRPPSKTPRGGRGWLEHQGGLKLRASEVMFLTMCAESH